MTVAMNCSSYIIDRAVPSKVIARLVSHQNTLETNDLIKTGRIQIPDDIWSLRCIVINFFQISRDIVSPSTVRSG